METINKRDFYKWCSIPWNKLSEYSPKVPCEVVSDSKAMGEKMAREVAEEIKYHNKKI